MSEQRARWRVTAVGDAERTGSAFADAGERVAWTVFRADGNDFPVFAAVRGDGPLPPVGELTTMTREAVADLLVGAGLLDPVGWITDNIAAALLMASLDVASWEGEEMALEEGPDGEALRWAGEDDARVQFLWLRARGVARNAWVRTYQDDPYFGLSFGLEWDALPAPADRTLHAA